jgi:nicotinate-nucleotide pyrophosphorylase (carboxylating)
VMHSLSKICHDQLRKQGLDADELSSLIERAFSEDVGDAGDVTSNATIAEGQFSLAQYVARVGGTISGICVVRAVLEMVVGDDQLKFDAFVDDGDRVHDGSVIVSVRAPTRSLLTAERTSLNLLGHLSGIATLTSKWVDEVAGTGAYIRDTRKTTPGLRSLEKFAVRCGGGINHRMGLSDAALIKDNHVAAAGSVSTAVLMVRKFDTQLPVEVEVDTLVQLREALDAGVDLVLLDNMDIATTKDAVEIVSRHQRDGGYDVMLESSGGLTLENARAVALTGVNFLAVGALTHSAPTLDIGLDFD